MSIRIKKADYQMHRDEYGMKLTSITNMVFAMGIEFYILMMVLLLTIITGLLLK